jgi:hypothetical protein
VSPMGVVPPPPHAASQRRPAQSDPMRTTLLGMKHLPRGFSIAPIKVGHTCGSVKPGAAAGAAYQRPTVVEIEAAGEARGSAT